MMPFTEGGGPGVTTDTRLYLACACAQRHNNFAQTCVYRPRVDILRM